MRFDDEDAVVLFEAIRWCCFLPVAFRWWRKGLVVRMLFLAPILLASDAASTYGLQGLPELTFIWGVCPLGLVYLNHLLWESVRQLIADAKENGKPSGARSIFVIVCFGLLRNTPKFSACSGLRILRLTLSRSLTTFLNPRISPL